MSQKSVRFNGRGLLGLCFLAPPFHAELLDGGLQSRSIDKAGDRNAELCSPFQFPGHPFTVRYTVSSSTPVNPATDVVGIGKDRA